MVDYIFFLYYQTRFPKLKLGIAPWSSIVGGASLLLDLHLRIARYREMRAIPRPTVAVATLIQSSTSTLVQEGKWYQNYKVKIKQKKNFNTNK